MGREWARAGSRHHARRRVSDHGVAEKTTHCHLSKTPGPPRDLPSLRTQRTPSCQGEKRRRVFLTARPTEGAAQAGEPGTRWRSRHEHPKTRTRGPPGPAGPRPTASSRGRGSALRSGRPAAPKRGPSVRTVPDPQPALASLAQSRTPPAARASSPGGETGVQRSQRPLGSHSVPRGPHWTCSTQQGPGTLLPIRRAGGSSPGA